MNTKRRAIFITQAAYVGFDISLLEYLSTCIVNDNPLPIINKVKITYFICVCILRFSILLGALFTVIWISRLQCITYFGCILFLKTKVFVCFFIIQLIVLGISGGVMQIMLMANALNITRNYSEYVGGKQRQNLLNLLKAIYSSFEFGRFATSLITINKLDEYSTFDLAFKLTCTAFIQLCTLYPLIYITVYRKSADNADFFTINKNEREDVCLKEMEMQVFKKMESAKVPILINSKKPKRKSSIIREKWAAQTIIAIILAMGFFSDSLLNTFQYVLYKYGSAFGNFSQAQRLSVIFATSSFGARILLLNMVQSHNIPTMLVLCFSLLGCGISACAFRFDSTKLTSCAILGGSVSLIQPLLVDLIASLSITEHRENIVLRITCALLCSGLIGSQSSTIFIKYLLDSCGVDLMAMVIFIVTIVLVGLFIYMINLQSIYECETVSSIAQLYIWQLFRGEGSQHQMIKRTRSIRRLFSSVRSSLRRRSDRAQSYAPNISTSYGNNATTIRTSGYRRLQRRIAQPSNITETVGEPSNFHKPSLATILKSRRQAYYQARSTSCNIPSNTLRIPFKMYRGVSRKRAMSFEEEESSCSFGGLTCASTPLDYCNDTKHIENSQ